MHTRQPPASAASCALKQGPNRAAGHAVHQHPARLGHLQLPWQAGDGEALPGLSSEGSLCALDGMQLLRS